MEGNTKFDLAGLEEPIKEASRFDLSGLEEGDLKKKASSEDGGGVPTLLKAPSEVSTSQSEQGGLDFSQTPSEILAKETPKEVKDTQKKTLKSFAFDINEAKRKSVEEPLKPIPLSKEEGFQKIDLLEKRQLAVNSLAKGQEALATKTANELTSLQETINKGQEQINKLSAEGRKQEAESLWNNLQPTILQFKEKEKELNSRLTKLNYYDKRAKATDQEMINISEGQQSINNQWDRLNAGLNTLSANFLRSPQFAYNTLITAQNKIAREIGLPEAPYQEEGYLSNMAKYFEQNADAYHKVVEKKQKQADYDIVSLFQKGENAKALNLLFENITESAPTTGAIALGGVAGLTNLGTTVGGGLVFGAGTFEENKKKGVDDATNVVNSWTNGLLEGIFESTGTLSIINDAKNIFAKSGKEAVEETAKNVWQQVYGKAAEKLFPVTSALKEGISEGETAFTQNIVNIVQGVDEEYNKKYQEIANSDLDEESKSQALSELTKEAMFKGVPDAFLTGVGMGAILGGGAKKGYVAVDDKNRKEVEEAKKKFNEYATTLTNPTVSVEAKDLIQQKAKEEADKIVAIQEQDDNDLKEKLTKEDYENVIEIQSKIDNLEKSIDNIDNEQSKAVVYEQVNELNKEKAEILKREIKQENEIRNTNNNIQPQVESPQEEINVKPIEVIAGEEQDNADGGVAEVVQGDGQALLDRKNELEKERDGLSIELFPLIIDPTEEEAKRMAEIEERNKVAQKRLSEIDNEIEEIDNKLKVDLPQEKAVGENVEVVANVKLNKAEKVAAEYNGQKEEDVVPTRAIFKNKVNQEVADWFGNTDEEDLEENAKDIRTETVNINDITPTQLIVDKNAIGKRKDKGLLPVLVKTEDGLFVLDGHHRISSEILSGNSNVEAKIIDLTDEGVEVVTPKVTSQAGSVGVVGDVTFKGKRGQADSITFDGKTIKQGEEIELNDVNISQDDSMPDLRSGKYKVRMLSVDANGKTATLTLTDGNEVITTTVKDLRKSEQSIKETPKAGSVSVGGDVKVPILKVEPKIEDKIEDKIEKTANELDNIPKTNSKETEVEYLARTENNRRKRSFYEKAKGILFKGFGGNASIISDKFGSKYKYFTDNPDYAKSFSLEKEYLTQKGKVEKYQTDYKKQYNTNETDYNNEVLKHSGKKSINDLTSKDFDNFNDKLKADGYDVVIIKRNEPLIPSEAYRGHSADIRNVEVEEHLILNDKAIKKISDQPSLLENNAKSISEAYHKAKADGSNPELVKAVEDLIGKEQSLKEAPQEVKVNTPEKVQEEVGNGQKDEKLLKSPTPNQILENIDTYSKNQLISILKQHDRNGDYNNASYEEAKALVVDIFNSKDYSVLDKQSKLKWLDIPVDKEAKIIKSPFKKQEDNSTIAKIKEYNGVDIVEGEIFMDTSGAEYRIEKVNENGDIEIVSLIDNEYNFFNGKNTINLSNNNVFDIFYKPIKVAEKEVKADKVVEDGSTSGYNPKFKTANKVLGEETTIEMPNGETREAEYMVVESDDILASHNEVSFNDTVGFPKTKDGRNANSRNYKGDKSAQLKVDDNAKNLKPSIVISDTATTDGGVPIISQEGIVISGNGRTMAIKLSQKIAPEKYQAYKADLLKRAAKFGIDPNEVAKMKNPILVKVDKNIKNYSVKTFDEFNGKFQKEESPIDKAIKRSSIIQNDEVLKDRILSIIGRHETMSDLFDNKADRKELFDFLVANDIILKQETPKYLQENGEFTPDGKDLINDVLIATILSPETLEATSNVKAFRNKIINALPVLTVNYKLGKNSLETEINDAILLQSKIATMGSQEDFWTHLKQLGMFETANPNTVIINRMINNGAINFKKFIVTYNKSMEIDENNLFAADQVLTKQQVIDNLKQSNLKENEKQIITNLEELYAANEQKRPSGNAKVDGGNKAEQPQTPTEKAIDVYKRLSENNDTSTRKEYKTLPESIKRVLDNIVNIHQQLEQKNIITKKGNCP